MEAHYSQRRSLLELGVFGITLGVLVRYFPLGSSGFTLLTALLSALVLVYAGVRMCSDRDLAARWGLQWSRPADSSCYSSEDLGQEVSGCIALLLTTSVGLLPVLFLRVFAPQSVCASNPASYLVWCAVQDFLFFGLVLSNIEELAGPIIAVVVTALLFGLSHFPYAGLMNVTTLAGAVWGYVFLQNRSLPLITVAHWLMGLALLG